MGITGLLSMITRGMSKEGVELTDVKLYEEAVEINNKVKVLIANNSYIVHKVNEGGGTKCWFDEYMVGEVLELLKDETWYPGDDIEAHGEWYKLTQVPSEPDTYYLIDEGFNLSEPLTLEQLKGSYTNVTLERKLFESQEEL